MELNYYIFIHKILKIIKINKLIQLIIPKNQKKSIQLLLIKKKKK